MMTARTLTAILAVTLFTATGASAQLAGTYSGHTADNNSISMVVTESGGIFTATTMNVGFVADCNTGNSVSEGWGFLANQQFVSKAMNFTSHNDYYYIYGNAHFSGNTVIKGVITSVTATFQPGHTPPIRAQFCSSPKQAFMLTKQ
jgi:hypothetical protein